MIGLLTFDGLVGNAFTCSSVSAVFADVPTNLARLLNGT